MVTGAIKHVYVIKLAREAPYIVSRLSDFLSRSEVHPTTEVCPQCRQVHSTPDAKLRAGDAGVKKSES